MQGRVFKKPEGKMKQVFLLLLLFSSLSFGQGIQLSAGDSTEWRATGGQMKFLFKNSDTVLGGGLLNGERYLGFSEKINYRDYKISAGSMYLPFILKTDFYSNTIPFAAAGLSVSKSGLTVFVGTTASQWAVPFFFGSKTAEMTGVLFYTKKLSNAWSFDSSEAFSHRQTAIQTLTYRPLEPLSLSFAGGIGSNSPFAAGRIAYQSYHWKGIINYTFRGDKFERVSTPYQTYVENKGLNVAGGFTSRHFAISGDHTSTLNVIRDTLVESTVTSMSTYGAFSILRLNASAFTGTSGGKPVSAQTAGLGATVGPVMGRMDVYHSPLATAISATFSEKINRRFSVTEYVQAHSVTLGGSYHSNRLRVSMGYGMSFFPVLNQFQKVLQAEITIQLPSSLTLTGSTLSTPDGRTHWTAYGNKYAQGPWGDIRVQHAASISGKYSYTGAVLDQSGTPVAGAAIKIGDVEVFTDRLGRFILPTKKKLSKPLSVLPQEFMCAGKWDVISAPSTIEPETEIRIVVGMATQSK